MSGEVGFTMTEADYVAANRDWFRAMMLKRRTLVRHLFTLAIVFAIGVAIGRFFDGELLARQFLFGWSMAGAMLVALVASYALGYALLPRRAGRLFRQQTAMHKPLSLAWSDEGILQVSAHGSGRYAWGDLHRWADGASAVLIFQTDNMFFVLPRRAVSDEQRLDIVETVRRAGLPRF